MPISTNSTSILVLENTLETKRCSTLLRESILTCKTKVLFLSYKFEIMRKYDDKLARESYFPTRQSQNSWIGELFS